MKFLHTMLRVRDIDKSIEFFALLKLEEVHRFEHVSGRFTLIFLRDQGKTFELEMTCNWDQKENYTIGDNFGHLAFSVDNIYDTCHIFKEYGAIVSVPPRDGVMAFIKSPDGISIELLQKGSALKFNEFWHNQPNIGTW
ncbi:MAG: VOC family protein [Gammaproteobacteria bacterium]|nr:VOC family protein [Gammaproteobacteria bacterium]